MSVLFKVTKAKFPFRNGIFQVKEAASVVEIEQVIPEEEIVEETVEETVEEPVVEEPVEEVVVVDPKLADCEEFSEKSVEYLGVNNITTVGELKDYLQKNNGDLTLLAKIGKKYAAVILEELTAWETNNKQ